MIINSRTSKCVHYHIKIKMIYLHEHQNNKPWRKKSEDLKSDYINQLLYEINRYYFIWLVTENSCGILISQLKKNSNYSDSDNFAFSFHVEKLCIEWNNWFAWQEHYYIIIDKNCNNKLQWWSRTVLAFISGGGQSAKTELII